MRAWPSPPSTQGSPWRAASVTTVPGSSPRRPARSTRSWRPWRRPGSRGPWRPWCSRPARRHWSRPAGTWWLLPPERPSPAAPAPASSIATGGSDAAAQVTVFGGPGFAAEVCEAPIAAGARAAGAAAGRSVPPSWTRRSGHRRARHRALLLLVDGLTGDTNQVVRGAYDAVGPVCPSSVAVPATTWPWTPPTSSAATGCRPAGWWASGWPRPARSASASATAGTRSARP